MLGSFWTVSLRTPVNRVARVDRPRSCASSQFPLRDGAVACPVGLPVRSSGADPPHRRTSEKVSAELVINRGCMAAPLRDLALLHDALRAAYDAL